MSADIVKFDSNPSMADALDVIDKLRADVASGAIICFAVSALDPDDATVFYCSAVKPIKRSRLIGCMATAYHDVIAGKLGDGN